MNSYREDCIEAKAVKEGIIDQRPVSGKSKSSRVRTVVVESRYSRNCPLVDIFPYKEQWQKWKAYRTEAEATTAMEAMRRKRDRFMEFRLRVPCETNKED